HTPDSSRFWVQGTETAGRDPEQFDKEYLRQWFAAQGYRGDGEPPAMPDDLVAEVAARYVAAYERLTGEEFIPGEQPALARIANNLAGFRPEVQPEAAVAGALQ
ncbi:MAG TPA: phosphoribosylaminoimidazolesuccinocarboxamide synthase, partial [Ardenticatenaceae bacterium]|nr:phosphoribosylaminoimidazolesuccinocarboxamide synthase [Ardenticatenaceae bacterium]